MKKIIVASFVVFLLAAGGYAAFQGDKTPAELLTGGGDSTVNTLDQWKSDGTNITQRTASKPVKLTGLSDGCLSLLSSIIHSSGSACGSGGGGGSGTISTTTPLVSGQVVYATGVATVGSTATSTLGGSGVVSVTSNPFIIGASPAVVSLTGGTGGQILAWLSGAATWTASTTLATISGTLNLATQVTGRLPFANLTQGAANTVLANPTGATADFQAVATSSLKIALSDTTGILPETRGGTNQSSYATGDTLYASAINTLSKLTIGTGGQVLAVVSGIPAWVATTTLATISGTLNLANQVTGVLLTANGGTGTSSPSGILYGDNNSTNHVNTVTIGTGLTFSGGTLAASGGSGITSVGPIGALQTGPAVTLATSSTAYNGLTSSTTITATTNTITFANTLAGLLGVGGGGTGLSTFTTGDTLYASNTNVLSKLAAGTGGFILGMSGGVPAWVASTTLSTISGLLNLANQVSGDLPFANLTQLGAGTVLANPTSATADAQAIATSSLFGIGTNGFVLAEVAGIPTWTATSTLATITGTLTVDKGGTGLTAVADGKLLMGGTAANPLAALATTTGAGTFLSQSYTTGRPAWTATTSLGVALSDTTGILPETRGGTNQSTYALGDTLYASGANTLSKLTGGVANNGKILTLASGIPAWTASTTAGTGLTYTGTAFNVNSSQSIATLSNLTNNGFVITSGSNGTLGVQQFPATVAQGGTNKTSYNSSMLIASDNAGTSLVSSSTPTMAAFYATSTTATSSIAAWLNIGAANTNFYPGAGLTVTGNLNNTSQTVLQNLNSGTTASADVILGGNLMTNTTYYGDLGYNSSGNTEAAYTAFAANDLYLYNNDASLDLATASTTNASAAIKFFTAGTLLAQERMRINNVGNIGIGTTSPFSNYKTEIASASGQQLVLSDGSLTNNQWGFRNIGGTLNISTSSPATGATSTPAGIQLSSSSTGTFLGVATSSPWRTLSVTGTAAIDGLSAAAAGTVTVCIDSTTKEIKLGGTATSCAPSSAKYKKDIATLDIGLDELMKLHPVSFFFKQGDSQQNIGFIAEEVFKVDPRLVGKDTDGSPSGLKLDNFASLIVKSIQDQQKEIENLKIGKIARSAEENWQWIFMAFLLLFIIGQQLQIQILKKKL